MLYFILHVISIFFIVAAANSNSKDIEYETPVKGIVDDLIENWESPFAYLKKRGYLQEDLSSAPELAEFQQQLQGYSFQEEKDLFLDKDSKRNLDKKEKYRTSDEAKEDLKNMFHNLFSSKNQSVAEDLKSKLNVDWDMNALKLKAQESATNYIKGPKVPVEEVDQDEDPFYEKPPVLKNPWLRNV